MIASTQTAYIRDLLPDAGKQVDLDKNFHRLGLDYDVLNDFINRVNAKGMSAQVQKIFLDINDTILKLYAEYTPPDCPDSKTLQDVVTVLNDANLELRIFAHRFAAIRFLIAQAEGKK
jgi:hypothetical protein